MEITSKGVLITNPYIVGFLTKNDNIELLNACDTVLETFCKTMDNCMNESSPVSITDYVDELKIHNKLEIESVKTKLDGFMNSLCDQVSGIKNSMYSLDDNIVSKVTTNVTNLSMQTMIDKIDTLTSKTQSTIARGSEGENTLMELLSRRLLSRDGYTVSIVSGISHSCDIMIQRVGYPTIRIESKATGRYSENKVMGREVEKFKRDLLHTNNHGIMVSLHSGITGIGNTEIQQLPNGKFAVYLSNNEYDIDIIIDMLHVLYKIDEVVEKDTVSDSIVVRHDAMKRVREYINDFNSKINTVKQHMKESIRVLSGIQLSMIESILIGKVEDTVDSTELEPTVLKCDNCAKVFKSKLGFSRHMESRKCKSVDNKDE